MVKATDQIRSSRSDGQNTKEALVAAGLAAINEVGYAGTTARNVASRAGMNSALVFYHFGSVDGLLLAGLESASRNRLARYEAAFAKVENLNEAFRAIRRLWKRDNAEAEVAAIRELVGSQTFSSKHRREITQALEPWFAFVERQVGVMAKDNPLLHLISANDIAFAAVAFVMGVETLQRLMPASKSVTSLLTAGEQLAGMYES